MASTATKPQILCLHGMSQSGAVFSNKIGGAKRKLSRQYDLHFLDGPVQLEQDLSSEGGETSSSPPLFGWWVRDNHGQHVGVETTFEYIKEQTKGQHYDAILGFSQGGLLATALALSGDVSGDIKAVVTAGAPYVEDAFDVALARGGTEGKTIPKLHFAGEVDAIIAVERVEQLCQEGGTGELMLHEKGHLFPTKAAQVNHMMDFLAKHVLKEETVSSS